MTALWKKLNFKDHKEILVLNAPESFQKDVEDIRAEANVITIVEDASDIHFAICFVQEQKVLDDAISELAPKFKGDAVIWFCYPKKSSKRYTCDFNRDTGWAKFGDYGLEGVRMVAIDEDWSALRFRKVEFIKKITRRESFALTKEGKQRITQKGD